MHPSARRIPRREIIDLLRAAGWHFDRQAPRVELYRRSGSVERIAVPRKNEFTELETRTLLRLAGFGPTEIDAVLRRAWKS